MTTDKLIDKVNEQRTNGGANCIYMSGQEGDAWFGAGNIGFASDGSGWLAAGNIHWTREGHLFTSGRFESNALGNRIVINPVTRKLEMFNDQNQLMLEMGFVGSEGNRYEPNIIMYDIGKDGVETGRTIMSGYNIRIVESSETIKYTDIKASGITIRDGDKFNHIGV